MLVLVKVTSEKRMEKDISDHIVLIIITSLQRAIARDVINVYKTIALAMKHEHGCDFTDM